MKDELLLTPEMIRTIYGILNKYFPYIGKKDMRYVATRKLYELFEAQLAKTKQHYEAKVAPPELLEATIQLRIEEAKHEDRERIIQEIFRDITREALIELGSESRSKLNLIVERVRIKWQALKGGSK